MLINQEFINHLTPVEVSFIKIGFISCGMLSALRLGSFREERI